MNTYTFVFTSTFDSTRPFYINIHIYIYTYIYMIDYLCVGAAWPQKEPAAEVVVARDAVGAVAVEFEGRKVNLR